MKKLKVGLIGTGYMGKAHAIAYRNAMAAFGIASDQLVCEMLAEVDAELAQQKAKEFGFHR